MGAGMESALKTNVGVTAQLTPYGDPSRSPIEVRCLGHIIAVPTPEAYAVHKMVINSQRGSKSSKDAQAIIGLWRFLDKERLEIVLAKLTKRERARADDVMEEYRLAHQHSSQ